MDWFWSILAVLAVIALIGAVNETAAVIVVAVGFLWWLGLRAVRGWTRTYERDL
jgi:hypothetical protein